MTQRHDDPPLPPAGETLAGDCGGPAWPLERGNATALEGRRRPET
jgi:hypothetical protein